MSARTSVWIATVIFVLGHPAPCGAQSEPLADALAWADSVIERATAEERVPGAVLLVAKEGRIVHERAFGFARLYGYDGERLARPEPMTPKHVFDLASVTKVLATTFAVMLQVDRGGIELSAPVHAYLPGFHGGGREEVTVRDLLTHRAGLHQWLPIYVHADNGEEAYDYIRGLPLPFSVGEERRYSDLGFMLLGYVVERASGQPLDRFLEEHLYRPLGLTSTAFNPRDKGLGPFAATSHGNPYERRMVADDDFGYRVDEDPDDFAEWRDSTLVGEVNDGNAYYAHGGVAGHAGLFSTASELQVLLSLLLDEGRHRGRQLIQPETIERFLHPQPFGHGLGWMLEAGATERGEVGPDAFFHPGFTGTYVRGVARHGLSIVLLTNRQNVGVNEAGLYPDIDELRRSIIERIEDAAGRGAPLR